MVILPLPNRKQWENQFCWNHGYNEYQLGGVVFFEWNYQRHWWKFEQFLVTDTLHDLYKLVSNKYIRYLQQLLCRNIDQFLSDQSKAQSDIFLIKNILLYLLTFFLRPFIRSNTIRGGKRYSSGTCESYWAFNGTLNGRNFSWQSSPFRGHLSQRGGGPLPFDISKKRK